MPLPAGRFRLYQRDASGSTQLLGEDRIQHTPKDERVSLVVGRSFDVRATRKRTNFERLGERAARETFAIELRNRKDEPETVEVIERAWGDWKIVSKSDGVHQGGRQHDPLHGPTQGGRGEDGDLHGRDEVVS